MDIPLSERPDQCRLYNSGLRNLKQIQPHCAWFQLRSVGAAMQGFITPSLTHQHYRTTAREGEEVWRRQDQGLGTPWTQRERLGMDVGLKQGLLACLWGPRSCQQGLSPSSFAPCQWWRETSCSDKMHTLNHRMVYQERILSGPVDSETGGCTHCYMYRQCGNHELYSWTKSSLVHEVSMGGKEFRTHPLKKEVRTDVMMCFYLLYIYFT